MLRIDKSRKMLKVEKWQMMLIIIISAIVAMSFTAFIVVKKTGYSDFVEVKARIINVYREEGRKTGSYAHFITYEYNYDNSNYTSKKQIFNQWGKKVGNFETIRCNPKKPQEIEDTYMVNGGILFVVFIGFIVICSIVILIHDWKL